MTGQYELDLIKLLSLNAYKIKHTFQAALFLFAVRHQSHIVDSILTDRFTLSTALRLCNAACFNYVLQPRLPSCLLLQSEAVPCQPMLRSTHIALQKSITIAASIV